MGKRSDFPRQPRDAYPTPESAMLPLLDHLEAGCIFEDGQDVLESGCTFDEPCCGDGQLVEHLENFGHKCLFASDVGLTEWMAVRVDIDPPATKWGENPRDFIKCNDEIYVMAGLDARKITSSPASYFITNPPWERDVLHGIIENLSRIIPTWLLIDADWMHTKQAVPYMAICRKIVSIGRVKWIPESKNTGMDNCCWYLFDASQDSEYRTMFHPRRD